MLYKQQSFSNFEPDLRYLDSFPFSREEFLFFDIETTGFSPRNTSLYLIGAVCFLDEHWTFLQWFAETPSEECEILNAFLAFCRSFRALVHFNGDGFDIPYLLFKAEKYTLSDTLSSMQSIDLYHLTRPYKKYLKLTHINQKSLESFLGIEREDRYNGGELIKIYQSYCQLKDADALSLLLLHNLDDLKGMTKLLPLLAYPLFLKDQDYTLRNLFWEDSVNGQPLLIAELDLKYPVPKQISNRLSLCYLTLQEGTAKLMIYAFEGELKYFISDYKNYYYIPLQDCAIHKHVASYLDPRERIPAKATTCYQRHRGLFLPQEKALFKPVFQESYHSDTFWFECTQQFMNSPSLLCLYIKSLISI